MNSEAKERKERQGNLVLLMFVAVALATLLVECAS